MRALLLLVTVILLAACSGAPPAPVEDRSVRPPPAGLESDGRYRVRRGDTLFGIAFGYGLDYRDVARWNGIPRPYTIYPDQMLRLSPPPAVRTAAAPTPRASTAPRTTDTGQVNPPPAQTAATESQHIAQVIVLL